MPANILSAIESILSEKITGKQTAAGGCITTNFILRTENNRQFFLKTNGSHGMFPCEANSLREIASSNTLRVPQVIAAEDDFLLLEFISTGNKKPDFFHTLGEGLAQMHRHTNSQYGFYENNYIGLTPQINLLPDTHLINWTSFYFEKRLLFQYKLAEKKGMVSSALKTGFHQLEKRIPAILDCVTEPPSLLHGDLWGGNYLCDKHHSPVLIDPAVYYGHRETDLAMTKLFGGFSSGFYKAYNKTYPMAEGWEYRENIYKLYHVLNHLNLFGKGYLSEAEYLVDYYL